MSVEPVAWPRLIVVAASATAPVVSIAAAARRAGWETTLALLAGERPLTLPANIDVAWLGSSARALARVSAAAGRLAPATDRAVARAGRRRAAIASRRGRRAAVRRFALAAEYAVTRVASVVVGAGARLGPAPNTAPDDALVKLVADLQPDIVHAVDAAAVSLVNRVQSPMTADDGTVIRILRGDAGVPATVAEHYETLSGVRPTAPRGFSGIRVSRPDRVAVADSPVTLGIGPVNFAGQAWAWARAAETHIDGVTSEVFAIPSPLGFSLDRAIRQRDFTTKAWQKRHEEFVAASYSHLLVEAFRPVFGPLRGQPVSGDLARLAELGIRVGIVSHGSDIRDPRRHAAAQPHSPFLPADDPVTVEMQRQVDRHVRVLDEFDGPHFVSTPDLLDYAPNAVWLPVVVDPDRWATDRPVLERARPVVVHVPSKARLKGSDLIDPLMARLDASGLITYRRLENIPFDEMPAVIADADIVLEQFVLGLYSAAACEAMAAGRVVVAHVPDAVRARIGEPLPVVEATVDDLVDVVTRIVEERDRSRSIAADGPGFVRRNHDGRRSARALLDFLGAHEVPPTASATRPQPPSDGAHGIAPGQ